MAMAMSEGELMQLGEQSYLEVIKRKTARLIQACCVGGALSVDASQQAIAKIGEFGLNLGLVFQMRDDLLDADDPVAVVLAERLLPDYLAQALKALEALDSLAVHPEVLVALRDLTVFCATREA